MSWGSRNIVKMGDGIREMEIEMVLGFARDKMCADLYLARKEEGVVYEEVKFNGGNQR